MSFFSQILEGSLLSNERLMQAREFYAPFRKQTTVQAAFARWTQRVSVQSPLGAAREIAGLAEAELAELEAEFVRAPMRPRSPWVGHAAVAGTIFTALACVGLAYAALVALPPAEARAVQTTSMGGLLVGLACLAAVLLSAFANVHATLSYGTLGLHVGTLDEQHPWLYTAANLVRHPIAEKYRLRTLAERGWLRGADVVLMRELVESQAALQRVRPARAIAEELQALPAPAEPSRPEPRVLQLTLPTLAAARPFAPEEPHAAANESAAL
jgi:hypothetical protein